MLPVVLFSAESPLIIDHLSKLDEDSNRMRFGYKSTPENIAKYVTRSFDNPNSVWYGYIHENKCIGSIHVYIDGDSCEFGISIDSEYRGKKLSNALFDRAIIYVKAQGVTTITMQCLSENVAMQHIARKNGMSVITIGPGEKSATVSIEPGNQVIASIEDVKMDILALVDSNIRNQIWLYNSINSIFNPRSIK